VGHAGKAADIVLVLDTSGMQEEGKMTSAAGAKQLVSC
jgi:hypothetical protein